MPGCWAPTLAEQSCFCSEPHDPLRRPTACWSPWRKATSLPTTCRRRDSFFCQLISWSAATLLPAAAIGRTLTSSQGENFVKRRLRWGVHGHLAITTDINVHLGAWLVADDGAVLVEPLFEVHACCCTVVAALAAAAVRGENAEKRSHRLKAAWEGKKKGSRAKDSWQKSVSVIVFAGALPTQWSQFLCSGTRWLQSTLIGSIQANTYISRAELKSCKSSRLRRFIGQNGGCQCCRSSEALFWF